MEKFSIPFLRKLCDTSLFWFIKIIGGSVEQGADISEEVHKPHCDFWQDDSIKRKGNLLPRGWRKTTCLTKWGTLWKYLGDHERRQLLPSENERLGRRFLNFIQQQILQNRMLRKIYPELLHIDKSYISRNRWSGEQCDLPRNGIFSEASITTIGVHGAAQSGHFTDISPDDIIGKKAMESPVVMEGVLRWHDNVKELSVEPDYRLPHGSIISILGTHWPGGMDYYSYVQEKYPEYQWRITPALKDVELQDTDNIKYIQSPRANQSESNWVSVDGKFSTQYYLDMLANPELEMWFWAQHQNNPRKSTALTKFDINWLKYFSFEEREKGTYVVCENDKEAFELKKIRLFGCIDPGGFAETRLIKKGSRNAIVIGGQPEDSIKKFVVYTWAGRLKEPERFLNEIFTAHEKFKPRTWKIETIAAQQYIYRDVLEAKIKKCPGLSISPMPSNITKNAKDDEIQTLINPMFNGQLYVHRNMRELIAEIAGYPNALTCDIINMVAKLNIFYWSRHKKEDLLKYNTDIQSWIEMRNDITGY